MHPGQEKLHRTGRLIGPALLLFALIGACQESPDVPLQAVEAALAADPACGNESFLSTVLYGSIEREVHWAAEELHCESMLRPNGQGVRLRFTGEAAGSQLAIILALPELERGATGAESPTVVTLTVEGSGRFFSTATPEFCWSDIEAQEPVGDSAELYDIAGTLYCVAPLGEINGEAAISIPEMAFRGIVDWSAS
ncbi:MAG: hypothetical protein ACR2QZ_13285 [Woeseiaceae bacterium]